MAKFVQIGRAGRLCDIIEFCVRSYFGQIAQYAGIVLFDDVKEFYLFGVCFPLQKGVKMRFARPKGLFEVVRNKLQQVVPLRDHGFYVFDLPFYFGIEVCGNVSVFAFGLGKNGKDDDKYRCRRKQEKPKRGIAQCDRRPLQKQPRSHRARNA